MADARKGIVACELDGVSVDQALCDSESRYRSVYEFANDAIFVIVDRVFTDCNAAALRMFGCARDYLVGKRPEEVSPEYQPEGRSSAELAPLLIERALEGDDHSFSWVHRREDGKDIFAEVTLSRFFWHGKPLVTATVRDVTARREAEQELARYRDHLEELVATRTAELEEARLRAEESDRLKSAFLATMSHELRTPLNSIIGFSGILLQELPGPLNAEQHKQLGMVRHSARHLLSLINDVLDLSKIEAGQLEVRKEPFDARASVLAVAESVSTELLRKDLRLEMNIAAEVGVIVGDKRRFEQVLLNLLGNAVKFTDRGEVEVRVYRFGASLEVTVRDTGIGIAQEHLARLFRPFCQVSQGLDRRYHGTGLGLSICKRLVELMDGEIGVRSELDVGSSFWFVLPAVACGGEA